MKFEECKVGDVVYLMTELRILDQTSKYYSKKICDNRQTRI